jgi:N-carbamoyl-L-amino-acid hydrolase
VPDGGAFDGPLGVVSAFAAFDVLLEKGFQPSRPLGIACFADEEGARFGVACAGSRLLTGLLAPERAHTLTDSDGVHLAAAMTHSGVGPTRLGRDEEALRRIGHFVELHIEQGRGLVDVGAAVGVASAIRPHGRWRIDLPGEANHAGTTLLADRRDAMIAAAEVVLAARAAAERHDAVATCGKLQIEPNGVNAIPSHATVWLDARAASAEQVRGVVTEVAETAERLGGTLIEQSWSDATGFPGAAQLAEVLDGAPVLDTGAGHDAGILAQAGVPSARQSSASACSAGEHAEADDCLAGVAALATVIEELAR